MIISDLVYQRFKEQEITDGVFILVSNDRESLIIEAEAFPNSLLGYTQKDLALNRKIYFPRGDTYYIDQISDFIDFEYRVAVGVPAKILILHDLDLVPDNLVDKLLKTVEDYNQDSFIVFTTQHFENVSKTVASRCMIFKDYKETSSIYEQQANKYLDFISKVKDKNYDNIEETVSSMKQLGCINIIQAMFYNLTDLTFLTIGKNALRALRTGSKEDQVAMYLYMAAWSYLHNIRTDFSTLGAY